MTISRRLTTIAGMLAAILAGSAPGMAAPLSGSASGGGATQGGSGAPGGGVGIPGAIVTGPRRQGSAPTIPGRPIATTAACIGTGAERCRECGDKGCAER